MFYVYLLKSLTNSRYYIGQPKDLVKRFAEHSEGRVKSTKRDTPFELKYIKKFATRSEAVQYEILLKSKKKRSQLENLINEFSASSSAG